MVGSGIAWMITGVAAMSERDSWTARVRRRIPRTSLLRALAFLFYTGSAGGLIFSAIMFAATYSATYFVCDVLSLDYGFAGSGPHIAGTASLIETAHNLTVVYGYILCYCLTTAFLRITVLRRLPTAAMALITAIVASFFLIVPYFIALMELRNTWRDPPWYMYFSPLILTTERSLAAESAFPVVVVWLLIGLIAGGPWILRQMRQFVPLEEKAISVT
jgi:hypothetical protein